jgi:DNA-binding transcriptional ArsR family regulator
VKEGRYLLYNRLQFEQARENDDEFSRLVWFLIGGGRGGENRAKILFAIHERPRNLNQLAKFIGVDYRSVQHHMSVLQKNNMVESSGERYGVVYSIHPWLNYHFRTFEKVCAKLGFQGTPLVEKSTGSFPGVTLQSGPASDVLLR